MKKNWYVWYNDNINTGSYKFCTWKEIEPISRTKVRGVSSEEEALDTLAEWYDGKRKCVEEDRNGYPYCKTHDCGADWPCGEIDCPHCKGIV